jgi:phosphopantothenoylcysteine decarboxylase/phosphopantothenate--cysteine ligase
MAAAVADYLPPSRDSKRKKTAEPWTVTMDRGPDILQELGASRATEMLVGFAAETENLEENARRKLGSKNLDLIVANDVSDPDIGFGSADNCVAMLASDGRRWDFPKTSKQQLAEQLVETWVEELVVRERAGV